MNTFIPVTHRSDQFPDDVVAAAARGILQAQGYSNVWSAEALRDAESLTVAALEAVSGQIIPRAIVADALATLLNQASEGIKKWLGHHNEANIHQDYRDSILATITELGLEKPDGE